MNVSHEPPGYECPFCVIVSGQESSNVATTQNEILLRDDMVTAFIASRQLPNNLGHVLVIPNEHFENLYSLPERYGGPLLSLTKRVATALKKSYACEGISIRQHNEPVGGQDVWHYHVHIFPRYENDGYFPNRNTPRPIDERLSQASLVRQHLE